MRNCSSFQTRCQNAILDVACRRFFRLAGKSGRSRCQIQRACAEIPDCLFVLALVVLLVLENEGNIEDDDEDDAQS